MGDLKYLDEKLQKHFGMNSKQSFVVLILLALAVLGGYVWATKNNQSGPANLLNNMLINPSSDKTGQLSNTADPNNSCKPKLFNENDWLIKYYKPVNEDGFYCPKGRTSFVSPDIWYKEKIPIEFKFLTMNYQVISENNDLDNTPSFIFSLGDSPRILRFYAPQGKNPQIVGFEKVALEDPENELKFEQARDLIEPIKYGTPVEISVRSLLRGGNKATFVFQLQYISNSGRSVRDNFEYNVDLPIPNPEGNYSVQFGFGTLRGNCVKPIDYNFCY